MRISELKKEELNKLLAKYAFDLAGDLPDEIMQDLASNSNIHFRLKESTLTEEEFDEMNDQIMAAEYIEINDLNQLWKGNRQLLEQNILDYYQVESLAPIIKKLANQSGNYPDL